MRFFLATTSEGKLREFRQILGDSVIAVPIDVEENGETFEENALIKARYLCDRCVQHFVYISEDAVLADDSGICVDALGGAPGVLSARWAEPGQRRVRLLKELQGITNRRACFVTAIACVFADGREFTVRGECFGVIAEANRGSNGFGYDPIFIPDEQSVVGDGVLDVPPPYTMAELSSEQKNSISHRAKAILALKARLNL